MDKAHTKGAPSKAKGAIKDSAGGVMKRLQQEGKADKASRESRKAFGDLKETEKAGQFGDD